MSNPSPGTDGGSALRLDIAPHDIEEWERAAAAVLRKARRLTDADPDSAVWEELTRHTVDGIAIPPLGTPASAEGLATSGRPTRQGRWDVRVRLDGDGVAAELAPEELDRGATSLWLAVHDPDQVTGALVHVDTSTVPVVLDAGTAWAEAARRYVDLLGETAVRPPAASNLGADPVGAAVRGHATTPEALAGAVVEAATLAAGAGVRGIVVDATAVHDLGASDAQEVGYSLAVAAAYLRALADSGFSVDDAADQLEFRYAATDDQFVTIAKLRAARRLWARMLELSGTTGGAQRQHAVTSRPMLSRYDPYVNLLRTTVAAFAAGVGGADAVTVLPFDTPLGEPDPLGRRTARNIHTLLMAESHVAVVADPAGGAYAVEQLTDELARAGWAELDRLESAGGVLEALADGSLQARIDEVVATRDHEVATRSRPLTGLSEFPDLGEQLPEREPATWADVRRYGARFEELRDAPTSQPVFLATMGSIAAHTARATFATNLLAAGGVGVEVAGATSGVEDVLAAYSGQPVVCLAGPDKTYAAWGADLVAALRGAGASRVVLAGVPGERTVPPDLLDDSCAMGIDALAFLTRTREALA